MARELAMASVARLDPAPRLLKFRKWQLVH